MTLKKERVKGRTREIGQESKMLSERIGPRPVVWLGDVTGDCLATQTALTVGQKDLHKYPCCTHTNTHTHKNVHSHSLTHTHTTFYNFAQVFRLITVGKQYLELTYKVGTVRLDANKQTSRNNSAGGTERFI